MTTGSLKIVSHQQAINLAEREHWIGVVSESGLEQLRDQLGIDLFLMILYEYLDDSPAVRICMCQNLPADYDGYFYTWRQQPVPLDRAVRVCKCVDVLSEIVFRFPQPISTVIRACVRVRSNNNSREYQYVAEIGIGTESYRCILDPPLPWSCC